MCHMFLGKLCPHDLFTNTKADLGSCGGLHDDDVKAEFDKLPPFKRQAYEDEFTRFAQVSAMLGMCYVCWDFLQCNHIPRGKVVVVSVFLK